MKNDQNSSNQGTYRNYLAGFSLSLLLTLLAYGLVWWQVREKNEVFSPRLLTLGIMMLALTQLLVQLVFFLHLGKESKPYWNLTVLLFAAGVVLILVAGSIWIMNNLKYHSPPQPNDQSIIDDEGIQVQQ